MTICDLSVWSVLLICAGVFTASFVDAVGGGGGLISLPVYLLAGLPPHLALGTNKLSAGIGTTASTWRYIRNGCVDWGMAAPSIALALVGAHIGTRLQLMADERYLEYVLLAVLPVAAFVMIKKRKESDELRRVDRRVQMLIVCAASLVVGAYDGFYGPGTGTFLLLIFTALAGMEVRTASGNVKLVNLSSNIGALVTSLAAGKVLVPIGLIAAVFSIAGHYLGAGLTIKNGNKIVRPIIFIVLGLLAAKIVLELAGE